MHYARKWRVEYDAGGLSKTEFILGVLDSAFYHQGKRRLVRNGAKALLELGKKEGPTEFIDIKRIRQRAGLEPKHSPTAGLYVWLEEYAGVVEKRQGRRRYRVKGEFREAFDEVVSRIS